MKRYLKYFSFLIFVFSLCVSFLLSSEPVDLKTAEKAAEYHGEYIFENNLKICDHELIYWPWGEPAVYVFTLVEENDYPSPSILLDNTLLQGKYLVHAGKEEEGLKIMAQAEKYMTVFIGATTDMPSFIKAYAGLPEHIIELALMEAPPSDPYWIYGGVFHIFISSKSDMVMGDNFATEIHLHETVALKDLGLKKAGTIPPSAEYDEWEPFRNPDGYIPEKEEASLFNIDGKAKQGKHLLKVKEYAYARWEGCSPAAFTNCLKYLQQMGKVSLGKGNTVRNLVSWAATCMRTDPKDGGTKDERIASGAAMLFRGLGYSSSCKMVERQDAKPLLFLNQFSDEINKKYPTEIGAGGGIYREHSTTGIGYWKDGNKAKLIVHDGYSSTPNQPVYTKFMDYPNKEIEYPETFNKFHPGGKGKYAEADVQLNAPETVLLNREKKQWKVEIKIKSKNKVKVLAYNHWKDHYDEKGKKYLPRYKGIPRKDYFRGITSTFNQPKYKKGKVVYTFFLIDANGHRLKEKYTVELKEGDIVGTWKGSLISLEDGKRVNLKWFIYKDGTFKDNYDSPNNRGKWSFKNGKVTLKYTNKEVKGLVLTGALNKDGNKILGRWTYLSYTNKWIAEKISEVPKAEPEEFGPESEQMGIASHKSLMNMLIKPKR